MREKYGVKMTEVEYIKFNKYITDNNYTMNTFTKEERTKITKDILKNIRKKEREVYGVEMSGFERMKFDKYIDNSNYAMNTFTKEERTKITKEILEIIRMKEIIKNSN